MSGTAPPSEAAADQIIARCASVEPRLAKAEVLGQLGLRPTRPEIRLEGQERPGGLVVHNYGHGGAGVSLAWGCAQSVLDILR